MIHLKAVRAGAIVLCCFASPASSAGIQLLDSDSRLAGAIWYPCEATPQLRQSGLSPRLRREYRRVFSQASWSMIDGEAAAQS
jgi:hypothetical protein